MFNSMVTNLMDTQSYSEPHSITIDDYLTWQKEYTFDALQDLRYGQSFCNKFNIQDNRIFYERDWVRSDAFIRSEWIERP
jgi:hypothetical protein